jgi:hypothetical protein
MNAMEQKVLLATDGPEDLPFAVRAALKRLSNKLRKKERRWRRASPCTAWNVRGMSLLAG